MMPFLELTQLGKSYDTQNGRSAIVKDFNLRVSEGEFVCIIGHSGCGKSTVLSITMGLNEATEGGVIIAGREVTGPGLDRGVVFQSPALLPWLTARENVLLAIDQISGRGSRQKNRERADRYLARVGLEDIADSYPEALSAGMRQRVGIAPAFARDPKVLLLDEPFSLLDVITRMELQDELMQLWESERKTVLMVTHDVDEALLLADRIVLMTNGPAATVGETVAVPFQRPRQRLTIVDDLHYQEARAHLITFLEERADHGRATAVPSLVQDLTKARVTEDDLFVVEKYTGLNRFRKKYYQPQALVGLIDESNAARPPVSSGRGSRSSKERIRTPVK